MLSSIKQRIDREDEGFTLIELMVVVLIIAILLAIAIPTFLGARNSANARSAQSNLRNALTAEQTFWTNNQTFTTDITTTSGMAGVDSAFTWTTGVPTAGNNVSVAIGDSGNEVAMSALAKDGNCYTVLQSNDPSASFTAYNVVAQTTGACSAASVPATLAAPNAGQASKNLGSAFYTSW